MAKAYGLSWLPEVLKAAGLTVNVDPAWTGRGHGDVGETMGVILHHTAGPLAGNAPSLPIVIKGRPDLPGPLCNLHLARNGAYTSVAAGKAWHAGAGYWQGITDGNGHMVGIEAENTGLANDSPWPAVQMDAYIAGVAAILTHIKKPSMFAAGHKEYATPHGRKSDPSFDMVLFRQLVRDKMEGPHIPLPIPTPPPGVMMVVTGVEPDTLAFRDEPNGDQTGALPEHTIVTMTATNGRWSQVTTGMGFVGWVASRFLEPVKVTA